MYRRLGSTAPGLKVISPGRYPDVSGPPYTRSSNRARPAADTATGPSHHPSAAAEIARSFAARGHCHDGAAEHHDVGVADEDRGLKRREPGQPRRGRRLAAASAASTAHSRAPVPAAISERRHVIAPGEQQRRPRGAEQHHGGRPAVAAQPAPGPEEQAQAAQRPVEQWRQRGLDGSLDRQINRSNYRPPVIRTFVSCEDPAWTDCGHELSRRRQGTCSWCLRCVRKGHSGMAAGLAPPELARSSRQRREQLTWDHWPGSYLKESWSLVR
jgi:hypothetical protein